MAVLPSDVLQFWFGDLLEPNPIWYNNIVNCRDYVNEEVTQWTEKALQGQFQDWERSTNGALALVILLSQFPRFVYLGTPRIVEGDEKALSLATSLLSSSDTSQLPILYQYFLLEPFYHSEDLHILQDGAKRLTELLQENRDNTLSEKSLLFLQSKSGYFQQNIERVEQFGCFPHRNLLLNRPITLEQRKWMKDQRNKAFINTKEPLTKLRKKKSQEQKDEGETSKPQKSRRLKILALHGMKQNGILFRSRTNRLRTALKPYADIVFLNGLFPWRSGNTSIPDTSHGLDNAHTRCWWHMVTEEDGTIRYEGINETLLYMENVFATQGPFDGVLGFSQGAGLAGILAAIQPLRSISFSFLIDISGFVARNEEHRNLLANGISGLPSIHISGLADTMVPPERTLELLNCFTSPPGLLSQHDKGHFSPNQWPLNDIAMFVSKQHSQVIQELEKVDYTALHPPIPHLLPKLEAALENGFPVGLLDSLQRQLQENVLWKRMRMQGEKKEISFSCAVAFFRTLLEDSTISCYSSRTIVEEFIAIAWSMKTAKREEPENCDSPFFSFLLASLHLIPKETLDVLSEIPIQGSWKDLCTLIKVQSQQEETSNENGIILFNRVVELFVEQLKQDQNSMNQLLSNQRIQNLSIGQLEEEGLLPSKCGAEAPRVKGTMGKRFHLPQAIARTLNPLHIPPGVDPNDPETREKLAYTKGISYARYYQLISSLRKIRVRCTKDYIGGLTNLHKNKVIHSLISEEGWQELLQVPISTEVLYPRPEPVVPCTLEELDPLLVWLGKNVVPESQTAFTKGTIVPDGRLDLCKQVIGPSGIDPLLYAMNGNEQVKRLLLGNNIIGDEGGKSIAKAIAENSIPNMDTWYIAGNNFSVVGIQPICEALYSSTTVKALWLKRNPLLPIGAVPLASLLHHNISLQTLDLDNCGLLDEGVTTLVGGLKENKTLKHLYLGVNGITVEGVRSLSSYLSMEDSMLETLFLSVNRVGDEGCKVLAPSFATNKNLRRLSLASNRIGDEGTNVLANSLLDSGHPLALLDLGFTKSTWAVREIGNRIGNEGAAALGRLLEKNTTLQSLYLLNNGIEDEGICAIATALESNRTLTSVGTTRFHTENETLSEHISSILERNKALSPSSIEIDLPEHVQEIYSVYRTKSPATKPFLNKFNWLQASDLDIIPDQ